MGQFAVFYPQGRQVFAGIPLATELAALCYTRGGSIDDGEYEEISKLAVGCLAKMMIGSWNSM